jgi:hypothetical protein
LKVMGDCIPTMLAAVYGIAVPDSPRCWLELFPLGFCHINLALRLSLLRLSQSFLATALNTGPSWSSSTCVHTRWCMREFPGPANPFDETPETWFQSDRLRAKVDVDRWLIAHGHPLY